ncbi:putative uridine nucleosidase 2 -like protein [Gossypium arboreum]|uniref:Putative uridine nucleosidase 2-like protein n=1 Tax=Gossypium arboreum TaxID=29729 RepID=A0A0B0NY97_GOSAR|nr:putative uridine nucleosidase 2 -like protein [Gossypium arboreum]
MKVETFNQLQQRIPERIIEHAVRGMLPKGRKFSKYDWTSGITFSLTRFAEITEWSDQPSVKVAVTIDAPADLKLVMERLME